MFDARIKLVAHEIEQSTVLMGFSVSNNSLAPDDQSRIIQNSPCHRHRTLSPSAPSANASEITLNRLPSQVERLTASSKPFNPFWINN